ncbi:hypothetical protein ACTFIY_002429 [Dictyostelium cf. discoideum]
MLKTLRFGTRAFGQNLNIVNRRNFCTRYTEDHEWVTSLGSQNYKLGITDFAQRQLGDIVFVETPQVGSSLSQGQPIAVVESVKAASDIYIPMEGSITTVNQELESSPELVNEDPMGDGWIVEFKSNKTDQFQSLMDKAQYDKYTKEQ